MRYQSKTRQQSRKQISRLWCSVSRETSLFFLKKEAEDLTDADCWDKNSESIFWSLFVRIPEPCRLTFFTNVPCKIVMFVSKDENKRREAWDGPFKKTIKNYTHPCLDKSANWRKVKKILCWMNYIKIQ